MKFLVEERRTPRQPTWQLAFLSTGGASRFPALRIHEGHRQRTGQNPPGEYSHLHALQNNQGWTRQRGRRDQEPWLISPDRSIVIGYDDAESITIKTEWILKQGFRGVFFWQIAGDRLPDGTNPLQQAARKALD